MGGFTFLPKKSSQLRTPRNAAHPERSSNYLIYLSKFRRLLFGTKFDLAVASCAAQAARSRQGPCTQLA